MHSFMCQAQIVKLSNEKTKQQAASYSCMNRLGVSGDHSAPVARSYTCSCQVQEYVPAGAELRREGLHEK